MSGPKLWPFKKKKPRPYASYLILEELGTTMKDEKLTKDSFIFIITKFNDLVEKHNELLDELNIGDKNTPRS